MYPLTKLGREIQQRKLNEKINIDSYISYKDRSAKLIVNKLKEIARQHKLLVGNYNFLIYSLILLIFSSCFEFLFLREFISLINHLQEKSDVRSSDMSLLLTALLLFIKIMLHLISSIYILDGVRKINYQIGTTAARNAIIYDETSASEIVRTVQSDVFYFGEFLKSFLFVSQDVLITFAVLVVLLFEINQTSVAIFMLLIFAFIIIGIGLKNYLTNLGTMRASALSLLATKLIEFNRYWDLINTSKKGTTSLSFLNRHFEKLYSIDFKRGILALLPKNISEVLLLILLVFLALASNTNLFEIIGIVLVVSLRLLPILGRLLNNVQVLFFSLSSIKNLARFSTLSQDILTTRRNICVRERDWKYIKVHSVDCEIAGKRYFHELSFSLIRGDKILLTGPNGAGKSTLIKLFMGVSSPAVSRGVINMQIDGTDISTLSEVINIGYIPQQTPIFAGTLYENLTLDFGQLQSKGSIAKLREITKKLKFTSLLNKFDNGFFDQTVSPEAPILSGGEWQMCAVVRALYLNFSFLIVDEGNSALDKFNSELLMNSLCSENALTLIFISHRDMTVNSFTREINLSK